MGEIVAWTNKLCRQYWFYHRVWQDQTYLAVTNDSLCVLKLNATFAWDLGFLSAGSDSNLA